MSELFDVSLFAKLLFAGVCLYALIYLPLDLHTIISEYKRITKRNGDNHR